MSVITRGEVVRRIVERTDLDEFTERVLDSFWDGPEFQRTHPPRAEVRAWVRWNLDLVIRWLAEGRAPTDAELEVFRENARARAAEGTPRDLVPANFRRASRFAWAALLEVATEEELPALLDSADLLFDYVDRVSRVYSDIYEQVTRARPVAPQEAACRVLLGRIERDEAPLPEDHLLADQLGFRLARAARAFVIASPGRSAAYHAELATTLRRRRALTASEGTRVVGLVNVKAPWRGLELDSSAIVAGSAPAIGSERGWKLQQLRMAVEVATSRGDAGEISVEEYLPELLLKRSPRIAAQIRGWVYGPLDRDHPELAHTLDLLVRHSFERAPTAAALPVHRNTLRDRIARISEITGVDLDCAHGRGLAWLAWLARRDSKVGSGAGGRV